MLEGPADGDQDLNFWTSEMEDVVLELMKDPVFKGNQNFTFEMVFQTGVVEWRSKFDN